MQRRPTAPVPPATTRWRRLLPRALLVAALAGPAALAIKPRDRFTLQDLEQAPGMTPGRFADLFEDFDFRFSPIIQPADDFLRARAGDCDDYAALADYILKLKGYTTRIVQIQLVGTNIDHAVCYVADQRVYLDYNNREYTFNLQRCGPALRDIATAVADSLERNWTVAFEFTYSYADRRKHIRYVVVKTEDPTRDPDRRPSTGSP